MEKEVADHVEQRHWEVVPISTVPRGDKLILAIWSMKHKQDLGSKIIKLKARLCAHGNANKRSQLLANVLTCSLLDHSPPGPDLVIDYWLAHALPGFCHGLSSS